MNENETRTAQPFVRRTRKVFYHPNGKGTGSALQLELHPAHEDTEGSIFLTVAPQRTIGMRTADDTVHPTFDWRNAVCLKLDLMDIAQILQVLRGVIVNMDYLMDIAGGTCTLKGNIRLPVNIRNASRLERVWTNYTFEKIRKQSREENDDAS